MGYNLSEYPNLKNWFERLHSIPSFDENLAGAQVLATAVKSVYENSPF